MLTIDVSQELDIWYRRVKAFCTSFSLGQDKDVDRAGVRHSCDRAATVFRTQTIGFSVCGRGKNIWTIFVVSEARD